jgi:hypothetical protein
LIISNDVIHVQVEGGEDDNVEGIIITNRDLLEGPT